MVEESFSTVHAKYRNELDKVEKLRGATLRELKTVVETQHQDFLKSKAVAAETMVKLQMEKSRAQVDDKCQEIQDLLEEQQERVTDARQKFEAELEAARSSFDQLMSAAKTEFDYELEELNWNPEDDYINDRCDTLLEEVILSWQSFKEKLWDGTDVKKAAGHFQAGISRAKADFNFKMHTARDNLIRGLGDSYRRDYDEDVKKAAEECVWLVSSAGQYFCETIHLWIQEQKAKEEVELKQQQVQEPPTPDQEESQAEVQNLSAEDQEEDHEIDDDDDEPELPEIPATVMQSTEDNLETEEQVTPDVPECSEKMALEREKLAIEREKIAYEMEKLAIEREKMAFEREKLAIEKEKMVIEREKMVVERSNMAYKRDKLLFDREKMMLEREKLELEKEKMKPAVQEPDIEEVPDAWSFEYENSWN